MHNTGIVIYRGDTPVEHLPRHLEVWGHEKGSNRPRKMTVATYTWDRSTYRDIEIPMMWYDEITLVVVGSAVQVLKYCHVPALCM